MGEALKRISVSTVNLVRAHSYESRALRTAILEALSPLGGIEAFIKSQDRVLLKPNLLTGARPTKACTTNPAIVREVALLVKEAGGKPFLGDSPAFGSARGVAKANGLLEIAEELKLPIVEFRGARFDSAGETFDHLRLSKEAMEADVVLNLPKIKSHVQLTATLAVKNLFGCVPGKLKAWWHLDSGKDRIKFGKMLVETAATINPQLTIVDGIIGHEGNGPSNGEPKELGLLCASNNVFALDHVLCAVLNIDPAAMPTMEAARLLNIGPQSLADIKILGLSIEEAYCPDWKLPDSLVPIDFGLPRVVRSTIRDAYTRWVLEPQRN
jgi:uncharacterized protein (DUF362 family)